MIQIYVSRYRVEVSQRQKSMNKYEGIDLRRILPKFPTGGIWGIKMAAEAKRNACHGEVSH